MVYIIKKSVYLFSISLIIFVFSCGYSNNMDNKLNELEVLKKALQELQLNISVIVSDKETTPRLAFIAKNNSKVDITIPEFCDSANRLEILEPNKQQPRRHSGESEKVRELVIKSSESKVWYLNTMDLFQLYKEDGLYRIKWKIYDEESPEILILREKDKIESQKTNTR